MTEDRGGVRWGIFIGVAVPLLLLGNVASLLAWSQAFSVSLYNVVHASGKANTDFGSLFAPPWAFSLAAGFAMLAVGLEYLLRAAVRSFRTNPEAILAPAARTGLIGVAICIGLAAAVWFSDIWRFPTTSLTPEREWLLVRNPYRYLALRLLPVFILGLAVSVASLFRYRVILPVIAVLTPLPVPWPLRSDWRWVEQEYQCTWPDLAQSPWLDVAVFGLLFACVVGIVAARVLRLGRPGYALALCAIAPWSWALLGAGAYLFLAGFAIP